MKRGIIYILLILVCIYIGIINREEAYFYVAALMLAVMVCLLAGLFTRFFRTGISMQMNIPVVEKNRTFHPELTVRSNSGQVRRRNRTALLGRLTMKMGYVRGLCPLLSAADMRSQRQM